MQIMNTSKAQKVAEPRWRRRSDARPEEILDAALAEFTARGVEADHGPIVAATENAANPHYHPSRETPRPFREGDIALIDLFATAKGEDVSPVIKNAKPKSWAELEKAVKP